jgi:hypothetical protein
MSRDALVVGINTYSYERLSNLTAPAQDAIGTNNSVLTTELLQALEPKEKQVAFLFNLKCYGKLCSHHTVKILLFYDCLYD